MEFSFSKTANFSSIDWDTLQNRPHLDDSLACSELQWFEKVPCCMSGYSVEYVIETGFKNGFSDSAEYKFLSNYPCLNGPELDVFFEKFSEKLHSTGNSWHGQAATCKGILDSTWTLIKNWFS